MPRRITTRRGFLSFGAVMTSYFKPALFTFLKELKANNRREWFQANKSRYEAEVKEPTLLFIADFAKHLKRVAPRFVADPRPVGGSMFRIYKDTRFSKDKTPYKTHVGAHFPHGSCGKDVSAPGFYLHLEPSESFGGGGIWHPGSDALQQIRQRIVDKSADWKKATSSLDIRGEKLIRPPRGFNPEHPLIEDIKHKDFYVMKSFTSKEVCSEAFLDLFVEACESATPLVRFVSHAIEVPWK